MKTYYLKYINKDDPNDFTIWETTEDCTKERCIVGHYMKEWQICLFNEDYYRLIECFNVDLLTKDEVFLESI